MAVDLVAGIQLILINFLTYVCCFCVCTNSSTMTHGKTNIKLQSKFFDNFSPRNVCDGCVGVTDPIPDRCRNSLSLLLHSMMSKHGFVLFYMGGSFENTRMFREI